MDLKKFGRNDRGVVKLDVCLFADDYPLNKKISCHTFTLNKYDYKTKIKQKSR